MSESEYINLNQVTQEEMDTIMMLTRKMEGGGAGESEHVPSPDTELQEGKNCYLLLCIFETVSLYPSSGYVCFTLLW